VAPDTAVRNKMPVEAVAQEALAVLRREAHPHLLQ
jgi:hypothetical protein